MVTVCPPNRATSCPVSTDHTRVVRSALLVTSHCPSRLKLADVTPPAWPSKRPISVPVSTSQRRTVRSHAPAPADRVKQVLGYPEHEPAQTALDHFLSTAASHEIEVMIVLMPVHPFYEDLVAEQGGAIVQPSLDLSDVRSRLAKPGSDWSYGNEAQAPFRGSDNVRSVQSGPLRRSISHLRFRRIQPHDAT